MAGVIQTIEMKTIVGTFWHPLQVFTKGWYHTDEVGFFPGLPFPLLGLHPPDSNLQHSICLLYPCTLVTQFLIFSFHIYWVSSPSPPHPHHLHSHPLIHTTEFPVFHCRAIMTNYPVEMLTQISKKAAELLSTSNPCLKVLAKSVYVQIKAGWYSGPRHPLARAETTQKRAFNK